MADEDNVIHVQFGASAPPPVEEDDTPVSEADLEKLEVFTEMVEKGTVMVTLDARRDGVVVPDDWADDLRLNLNFCHGFGIPDFEYDERSVRASLSFGGVDIYCVVPWGSVYMMRSHVENEAMLFPADIPPEMMMFVDPAIDD